MKKKSFIAFLLLSVWHLAFGQPQKITVAQNGSGDYKTVQEAINAVAEDNTVTTIIFIKNGIYKEKLRLPETKRNMHFIGESVEKTMLTYDDFASKKTLQAKKSALRVLPVSSF